MTSKRSEKIKPTKKQLSLYEKSLLSIDKAELESDIEYAKATLALDILKKITNCDAVTIAAEKYLVNFFNGTVLENSVKETI